LGAAQKQRELLLAQAAAMRHRTMRLAVPLLCDGQSPQHELGQVTLLPPVFGQRLLCLPERP
ncbi:MAG: hypothetical protein EB145_01960, partial [Proteobacteria bacterium]|nr:hypothetical protein [Pseudomonadota bacterium]